MNKEEFERKIKEDPHDLADEIREGKMPFSELSELVNNRYIIKPPVVKVAYIMHPDCTVDEFKKHYRLLVARSGISNMKGVLKGTTLVKHLDVIAFILEAKNDSLDEIKKTFQRFPSSFIVIGKNKNSHPEFREMAFIMTNDNDMLPQDAQDIFLF